MGVSRQSYAAQRGVSEAAVRKAMTAGRITTLPDGTIDPAREDTEWGAQTDPAKQRGLHARRMGAETAAGTGAGGGHQAGAAEGDQGSGRYPARFRDRSGHN